MTATPLPSVICEVDRAVDGGPVVHGVDDDLAAKARRIDREQVQGVCQFDPSSRDIRSGADHLDRLIGSDILAWPERHRTVNSKLYVPGPYSLGRRRS